MAWGAVFGLVTAFGLVSTSSVIADRLRAGRGFTWIEPLATEMTGAYSILLLIPLALWFMRRYPIGRRSWPWRVPLHLGASVVFGAGGTLLMWGSRSLLWRVAGWGAYDYGDLRFRVPMEYPKQLLAYVIIYAAFAGLRWIERTREQERRTERLERQVVEARLAALKMQLNPHFLFNTLNMISTFVHEDPGAADTMLAHLSDFLRLSLHAGEAREVTLATELRFLDAYLAIMTARFGDRLAVDVAVDPDTREALVPPLLLQPLVENAVQHCTGEAGKIGRIDVRIENDGGRLTLRIEDNGPGLRGSAQAALGHGVGLSNTAERLRALYGDDHRLVLENTRPSGLRVLLDLPLRRAAPTAVATP